METAGNGVWDLVLDANSDPMVYKLLKSAFWGRKIQFSVKIRKFGTRSAEDSPVSNFQESDGFSQKIVPNFSEIFRNIWQ